jgi:porin
MRFVLALTFFRVLGTQLLLADQFDPEQKAGDDTHLEADQQRGIGEFSQLAGPNGVTEELIRDQQKHDAFDGIDLLEPWFNWKQNLVDEHDLRPGFKFWLLMQTASESTSDTDDAAGGIYRFQGSWTAFSGDSGEVGRIEWRVEKRAGLGSMLAPADLSGDTGFGYSGSFTTDIFVLSWSQGFKDHRFGYVVGRLASDVYSDAFVFSTFSRGYLNRSSLFNPTQGTTGVGALGVGVKVFVTDQIWLGGHTYDGNAASGDFDLNTFKQHEWLKEIEIGWAPSFARRPTDRVQFLYWDKDERVEAGVSSGKGWVVTASYQTTEKLLSFCRVGRSDGGAGVPAETAASVGLEYSPKVGRALAVGLGWASPSEDTYGPGLCDEYVVELSYRYQLTKIVSLTPDIQVVFNPAVDRAWVLGLRESLAL